MPYQFQNRIEGGQRLAEVLSGYKGRQDVLLLALPRGGVPVAFEVSKLLDLPMDVLIVRKLGVPGHEELAMGAITLNDINYINEDIIEKLEIPENKIKHVISIEKQELLRRNFLYRGEVPPPKLKKKTIILIDDGIATDATMRAAIVMLKRAKVAHIIAAVPVASQSTLNELMADVDDIACPYTPEPFYGVGQWYRDFSQTSDEEVQQILKYSTHNDSTKKVRYS